MQLLAAAAVIALANFAQAHYYFPTTTYKGVTSKEFEYIRGIGGELVQGPELDVFGPNITCNRMDADPFQDMGTKVLDVKAGSTIEFSGSTKIFHQGPLQFWLAKAPEGQNVKDFDGSGDAWFKIYSDEPTVIEEHLTWPNWDKDTLSIKIPECIADGEYLLRSEQIGLHLALDRGRAEFYVSCAQIRVTGGSGTYKPSPFDLLAFPGSYDPNDPGLYINIWHPVPTNYTAPGGPVMQC